MIVCVCVCVCVCQRTCISTQGVNNRGSDQGGGVMSEVTMLGWVQGSPCGVRVHHVGSRLPMLADTKNSSISSSSESSISGVKAYLRGVRGVMSQTVPGRHCSADCLTRDSQIKNIHFF